jgi:TPP-dependent pyruvate/acetoin dehydrogenase alpha subunit
MESRVSAELAISLLRTMIRARALEDRLHILYKQSRIRGRLISGRGQEAICVGATAALHDDEVICPVHRDLGAHLRRGTTPLAVMLHYFGRADGPSSGRDGDIHMGEWSRKIFPMISHLPDSWPIAVGIGMANSRRTPYQAVLAFCGDGATSTGLWHESLNMAAVFQTPNVFVVENNQFAYSTPVARQFRISHIAERAAGYGVPGVTVDGNDVRAVYEATSEAVTRARSGGGPTLIEATTMRIDGLAVHDPAEYVPPQLLSDWRAKDPIERLAQFLLRDQIDQAAVDDIWAEARDEMVAAADQAEASALPAPADLIHGVYAPA